MAQKYRPGVYIVVSDPYMADNGAAIEHQYVDVYIPGKGILSPCTDNLMVVPQ